MKILLTLFFFSAGLSLSGQENSTRSKLEAAYKGYITSCEAGKGKNALHYLDRNSKEFFDVMLNDLWYADSMILEKLPLAEKHLILLIRQTNPYNQLVAFNPNTLAIYTLSNFGPLGSYIEEGYTLGELRVVDKKALARLMVRGYPMDPEFEFAKENGHWKLNVIPILRDTESHLLARVKKTNTTEKQLISFIIESYSGKPIGPDIWKAVKK